MMAIATNDANGATTLIEPRALPNFVETPFVKGIVERALLYTGADFPIHFTGAAGTGKTTLAMHVASKIGRPVIMLHGNEEFSTSDLVGGDNGYQIRRVVDNYVHSVLKTEEHLNRQWIDNRLTVACRNGFTLVYDEFTRSRPEANNVLLSVLQEKMLDLSAAGNGESYIRIHPDFTAIFTSNPEEYAGVYRSQDALLDRMITLDLNQMDEETEVRIVEARSGTDRANAEVIVRIVQGLRESGVYEFPPTIRGCIMVARAMKVRKASITTGDNLFFRQVCMDVLASEYSRLRQTSDIARAREILNELIGRHCRWSPISR